MATIRVTDHEIEVRLTRWEKVAALHGNLHIPRRAIRGIEVVENAMTAVRGVRVPGLHPPRRRAVGTWRHRHGKDFVAARRSPGVALVLDGQPWSAVIVSLPDAEGVAAQLR